MYLRRVHFRSRLSQRMEALIADERTAAGVSGFQSLEMGGRVFFQLSQPDWGRGFATCWGKRTRFAVAAFSLGA